jgi:hypothetical protein
VSPSLGARRRRPKGKRRRRKKKGKKEKRERRGKGKDVKAQFFCFCFSHFFFHIRTCIVCMLMVYGCLWVRVQIIFMVSFHGYPVFQDGFCICAWLLLLPMLACMLEIE